MLIIVILPVYNTNYFSKFAAGDWVVPGLQASLCSCLLNMEIGKKVYLSCNPNSYIQKKILSLVSLPAPIQFWLQ